MSLKFKSLSLLSKLLIIFSLLLLFLWVVPTILNYYENLNQYNSKKSSLHEVNIKHGITEMAEKFNLEKFKTDSSIHFLAIRVDSQKEGRHQITIEVEKDKIKTLNSFIETLALRYLVSIENNELKLEEKDKVLVAIFTLKEL
jgi:cell division protein YceG involved in septum cleavage